jgi:hypothetical protein
MGTVAGPNGFKVREKLPATSNSMLKVLGTSRFEGSVDLRAQGPQSSARLHRQDV